MNAGLFFSGYYLFLYALVFYFGTAIGSFLNVVILRLPKQQSLTGRSHCPHCGRTLSFWELFPLLSFLFLAGRCANCRKKISVRYFAIEFITGLLFLGSVFMFRPATLASWIHLIQVLFFVSISVCIFVIDFEHYLILDAITFPSAVVLFIGNAAWDLSRHQQLLSFHSATVLGLVGALAVGLPFFLVWYISRGRWLGFGDVKLLVLLGLALLWPVVAIAVLLAIFLGGVVSMFLLASRKKTLKSQIPFGTFLAVAGVLALFFGQQLLAWYLSVLGF